MKLKRQALDLSTVFTKKPGKIDFILPGLISGTIGALVSPGGVGKSMLAIQIGINICGGPDLIGIGRQKTGSVVYLPAEDPILPIKRRLYEMGKHLTLDEIEQVAGNLTITPLIACKINILKPKWHQYLVDMAQGRRLLIIDTLRRFHTEEENHSGPMAEVIAQMEEIAHQTGCSILFLHHTSKFASSQGASDQQHASRGSTVLVDNVRWNSYLTPMSPKEAREFNIPPSQQSNYVRFGVSKLNYDQPLSPIWLVRSKGGVLLPTSNLTRTSKPKGKTIEYI